jgi:hypothetical protein
MRTLAFAAKKLREGDTFTANNDPEVAGHTVTALAQFGGPVAVGLSDGTTTLLDRRVVVEVQR